MRHVLDIRDHVELVVHAIDKIHVSSPADSKHSFRAVSATAAVGMRGSVFRPAIGFSFDDDSGDAQTVSIWHDQLLAQQIARDFEDIGASVEIARQFLHSLEHPQITQITPIRKRKSKPGRLRREQRLVFSKKQSVYSADSGHLIFHSITIVIANPI